MVRGSLAAAKRIRFHQQPGAVADRGNRLAALDEVSHHLHGFFINAQKIWVDLPAGQNQGVELLRLHILRLEIDGHGIAPILLVPALDLAGFDGCDLDGGASLLQLLQRNPKFRSFIAVGGQNKDGSGIDSGHSLLLRSISSGSFTSGLRKGHGR
jgi:hypothetical protein